MIVFAKLYDPVKTSPGLLTLTVSFKSPGGALETLTVSVLLSDLFKVKWFREGTAWGGLEHWGFIFRRRRKS